MRNQLFNYLTRFIVDASALTSPYNGDNQNDKSWLKSSEWIMPFTKEQVRGLNTSSDSNTWEDSFQMG